MLKVNIASGTQALPGWDNLDASYNIWLTKYPVLKKALFRLGLLDETQFRADWPPYVRRYNVIRGLPYDDCSVDFIYCSHFLEHVAKTEAIKILKECHRVLKPEGLIRLVVPDLKVLAKKYLKNDSDFFSKTEGQCLSDKFLTSIGLGPRKRPKRALVLLYERFFSTSRHRYMYDSDSLMFLLTSLGFKNTEKKGFKKGRVPDIEVLDNRPDESLYLEAMK